MEFRKKTTFEENLKYVRETLMDGENFKLKFNWRFDEQQADAFNNDWTNEKFFQALAGVIDKIEEINSL